MIVWGTIYCKCVWFCEGITLIFLAPVSNCCLFLHVLTYIQIKYFLNTHVFFGISKICWLQNIEVDVWHVYLTNSLLESVLVPLSSSRLVCERKWPGRQWRWWGCKQQTTFFTSGNHDDATVGICNRLSLLWIHEQLWRITMMYTTMKWFCDETMLYMKMIWMLQIGEALQLARLKLQTSKADAYQSQEQSRPIQNPRTDSA